MGMTIGDKHSALAHLPIERDGADKIKVAGPWEFREGKSQLNLLQSFFAGFFQRFLKKATP